MAPHFMYPQAVLRLRPTILASVVLLLLVTIASIAGVAFVATSSSLEVLVQQHMASTAQAAEGQVARLLSPAPGILRQLDLAMRRGQLSDPQVMGERSVEHMRQHPQLGWLGYADLGRRSYAGGVRGADGVLLFNHSDQGGVAQEAIIHPDGRFEPVPTTHPEAYDPTTRDWFTAALSQPELRWLEPYQFTSGPWGLSVTLGVVRDGTPIGVLTADFFLEELTAYLDQLEVGRSGRVLVITEGGAVLGTTEGLNAERIRDAPSGALILDDVAYRLVSRPLKMQDGPPWRTVVLVPEEELTGVARDNAWSTVMLGGFATWLAMIFAVWFSAAISKPILAMRADLSRISRLDISTEPTPRSRIKEVADMAEAVDSMKAGLRSFTRYAPLNLVRRLLERGQEARIGVEVREMSIMFSDIAGFTAVSESTDPKALVEALGEYLEAMNLAITTTEGTVAQYLGDGIMAFWGAPDVQADHALRACRGALAMDRVSTTLCSNAPQSGRPALPTRLGVNSGQVLVGNIGAPQRFNYNALGDVVNTASRIEGLNKVYGTRILVGERTAELLNGALLLRAVDQVRVKGKAIPIRVFEVVAEREDASAAQHRLCQDYEQALQRYLERDFDQAASRLEGLAADGDPASAELLRRCRQFIEEPPPADWDGTWVMESK